MKRIPITRPSISKGEITYVDDAVRNGWGENCYDYIEKFGCSFAEYLGVKYGLATSCCTGAIHLALMALGVKPGDEIILPDITWIATVEPVMYIGAKPVFVDVLEDTWCIDPEKIEKAIIVVHLYGNMAEMDEIMGIAKKNNLKALEDAAEALGSEYKEKKAGSIGDVGLFSFHGTKTITTGEGGMLVTNDPGVKERAGILNNHGLDPSVGKTFRMAEYGYKYKMSNLQAAIGCAQIGRANELIAKKINIFNWYKEGFSDVREIILNHEQDYVKNSYWMPTILFARSFKVDRDELIEYLNGKNIDSRPFFYPLSSLPMFREEKKNLVSYDIYHRGVNLPSFPDMEKGEVDYVVQSVIDYINTKS